MKKKKISKSKKQTTQTPVLAVELVPRTSWGRSLHKLLSREAWFDLRKRFDATEGPCPLCKEGNYSSPLHLHEVWEYDDKNRIQKLIGLQPICSRCHDVKHLGRAIRVGLGEKIIKHLVRVNKWDQKTTIKYISEAFSKWEERSKYEYQLDVSYLNEYFFHPPKLHFEWLADDPRRLGDKYGAISWAQEILKSEALVLDTETTGLLDSPHSEVVQVAVINMRGAIVYNKYIKPKRTIPKRVIEYHHITNEMVADLPIFSAIYPELRSLLERKTIVAYKEEFDRGILKQTCDLYDLPEISCAWECAMRKFRDYLDCNGFPRLPEATHNAAEDCIKTLALIKQIASAMPL